MAKRDIAQTIVEENPENDYNVETLEEENTERELIQLRDELREQKDQPPETEQDELPSTPPEREAIQEGEKDGTLYRLRDPNSSFNDVNFTLAGDQKKPLPDNPSAALLDRIDAGFIVEADGE